MTPHLAQTSEATADLLATLPADEQRLALLGLCDFEGQWDILEAATRLVVDGEAKAALIRQRLLPLADQLSASTEAEVTAYQLWIARHWFAAQFCRGETPPQPAVQQPPARPKVARGARRAQGRDK